MTLEKLTTCEHWSPDHEVCCISTPCEKVCGPMREVAERKHTIHCYSCGETFTYKGFCYPAHIRSYELCNQCRNKIDTSQSLPDQEYIARLNGCELCGSSTSELNYSSGIAAMCEDVSSCDKRIEEQGQVSLCSLCERIYYRKEKERREILCSHCVKQLV